MPKQESVLDNDTYKIICDFRIQTDHLIPARRLNPVIINKRKENLPSRGFYCSCGPHRMKIKEIENIKKKYLHISRELKKKLQNICVTVIPIVIGALETVPEGDWRNWYSDEESRPSRRQHCWARPEYSKGSWRREETCSHSNSNARSPNNAGIKKL